MTKKSNIIAGINVILYHLLIVW